MVDPWFRMGWTLDVMTEKGLSHYDRKGDGNIRRFANCILTGTSTASHGYRTAQDLQVTRTLYDTEQTDTIAYLRGFGHNQ